MIGTWFHKVLNILRESAVFLIPKVSRRGITHYLSICRSAVSMVVPIASSRDRSSGEPMLLHV